MPANLPNPLHFDKRGLPQTYTALNSRRVSSQTTAADCPRSRPCAGMADDPAASAPVRCTLVSEGPRVSIESATRGYEAAGSGGGDPSEVENSASFSSCMRFYIHILNGYFHIASDLQCCYKRFSIDELLQRPLYEANWYLIPEDHDASLILDFAKSCATSFKERLYLRLGWSTVVVFTYKEPVDDLVMRTLVEIGTSFLDANRTLVLDSMADVPHGATRNKLLHKHILHRTDLERRFKQTGDNRYTVCL